MPPPPPPPPAAGLPSADSKPGVVNLLADIQKGTRLKKAVTVDKSAPVIDKNTQTSAGGGGGGGGVGSNGSLTGGNNNTGPATQLGGLFAGGMPTLKKTGLRSTSGPKPYTNNSAPRSPAASKTLPKSPPKKVSTPSVTNAPAQPTGGFSRAPPVRTASPGNRPAPPGGRAPPPPSRRGPPPPRSAPPATPTFQAKAAPTPSDSTSFRLKSRPQSYSTSTTPAIATKESYDTGIAKNFRFHSVHELPPPPRFTGSTKTYTGSVTKGNMVGEDRGTPVRFGDAERGSAVPPTSRRVTSASPIGGNRAPPPPPPSRRTAPPPPGRR
eukprot:CFRG7922T1